jgi:thiol-disulfide isomerase/thioredoxin
MKIFAAIFLLVIMLPIISQAGQVGTVAPECNLPDLKGNIVTLQEMKGKVVFLDFWAPWCDQCKEEIPVLDALFRKYRDNGLVVIAVDIDSSEKLLMDFLQKAPVTFMVLMDGKGAMRRAYRFRTLPTAFIIGKDGVIRYVHMGFGAEFLQTFEKEIVELLKQ